MLSMSMKRMIYNNFCLLFLQTNAKLCQIMTSQEMRIIIFSGHEYVNFVFPSALKHRWWIISNKVIVTLHQWEKNCKHSNNGQLPDSFSFI